MPWTIERALFADFFPVRAVPEDAWSVNAFENEKTVAWPDWQPEE
jgi:hypothetical protein